MTGRTATMTALAAACLLAACNKTPETAPETTATPQPGAASAQAAPEHPAATPGPTITPQVEPAQAEPAPPSDIIATQPGPSGTTWNLTRAQVSGQILTLQFSVKTSPDRSVTMVGIPLDQISLIDDASSQSYSLLQEDGGRYMAAPLNPAGKQLSVSSGARDEAVVVWLKYPAPPEGSDRVSLTLPQVGPFDGIPVSR